MKPLVIGVALTCWSAVLANAALGYTVSEKPPAKVGQVIIVGNTITQDWVIRKVVDLQPGQRLQYPQLRLAEMNLIRMGIFEVNPARGIRPSVTVVDGDGEFKDVLVTVRETRTGSVQLKPSINAKGELVVGLVVEERNFDPWRWPTSTADFCYGRAFRGAGQKVCLELLQVPVLPCSFPGLAPLGKALQMTGGWPLNMVGH